MEFLAPVPQQGACPAWASARAATLPKVQEGAALSANLAETSAEVRVVELDDFNPASFDSRVPLVVRGGAGRARLRWTDDWVLHHFGPGVCQVSLDSRPALGPFKRQVPLRRYMVALAQRGSAAAPRGYLFQTQRDVDGAAELLEDLDVPEAMLALGKPSLYRFFMGPPGSGTLPHVHTHAVNALARGRKRWAIYVGRDGPETRRLLADSDDRYSSGTQARDWFRRELAPLASRELRLWEFEQEAGDLVYIPAFFIHAVLNLEPVMGFTLELHPDDRQPGELL
jgi:hypothetical protein